MIYSVLGLEVFEPMALTFFIRFQKKALEKIRMQAGLKKAARTLIRLGPYSFLPLVLCWFLVGRDKKS